MKTKRRQTVSVIIPTKNRPESLKRVLLALNKQIPRVYEIVVVDTSDRAFQKQTGVVARAFPSMDIQYHVLPRGSASGARNYGIAHSTGNILAFLDDDAVPVSGWSRAIHQSAKAGPFWFRGQCLDVSSERTIIHEFYALYREITTRDLKRQWSSYDHWKGYQMVDFIQAGNFFVSRDILEKINPVFDEHLFPFIAEGTDLSLRIRAFGHQILYAPKAKIRHYFLRLGYRNFILYSAFWYGRASAIFNRRTKRSISRLGSFGDTVAAAMQKKKTAHFWKLIREGYNLFLTKYSGNMLYNCAFFLTAINYLLFLGIGYTYGLLEYTWRAHIARESV